MPKIKRLRLINCLFCQTPFPVNPINGKDKYCSPTCLVERRKIRQRKIKICRICHRLIPFASLWRKLYCSEGCRKVRFKQLHRITNRNYINRKKYNERTTIFAELAELKRSIKK